MGYSLAHSPEDEFYDWFMSLKQPDNKIASCCGPADQFYAEDFRQSLTDPNQYEALVKGAWVTVPENKIDWGINNPTGRSVIFVNKEGRVYCFIPANSI